ncbi:hypothetical protein [Inquilinus limosus]|uniref:hypothetical protein n=1 Tax=Inquilinus limosus TaxID=171674 RepID=UPI00047893B8|nr:hypothetical protein [Inquilinus limosus]
MIADTRAEIREAVDEYENNLRAAADLCHAVVLLLRSSGPFEEADVAAVRRVAEEAEMFAKTARDDWPLIGREAIAAS